MDTEVLRAAEFAKARHAAKGQFYSGQPYEAHLGPVHDTLVRHGYTSVAYRQAAWLHDTVEDTDTKIEEIHATFGFETGAHVWSVTGVGRNRKVRNADIKDKLATHPDGRPLKCADRIVNHRTTIREVDTGTGEKSGMHYVRMYLDERAEFEKLMLGWVNATMWAELQETYDLLEGVLRAHDA